MTLLVREEVAYNTERGSDVHVLLLDTKEAFNRVWTAGLFYKLYKIGVNGKLWSLLKSWNNNLIALSFEYRTNAVRPLCIQQGVFQGGKMSTRLFQVAPTSVCQRPAGQTGGNWARNSSMWPICTVWEPDFRLQNSTISFVPGMHLQGLARLQRSIAINGAL